MNLHKNKKGLRAKALAVRADLSQDVDFIAESTSSFAKGLLSIPEVRQALDYCSRGEKICFASYAPSKGEANPNAFLDLLESRGKQRPHMAFPRVAGKGRLSMHFAVLEKLLPGSFGIPEPEDDLPLASLKDISVILVPGLAFDTQGNRLGYGKGYYDYLLAPLQDLRSSQESPSKAKSKEASASDNRIAAENRSCDLPLLIGICFEETLFKSVPAEEHDVQMDYVLTPRRAIRTSCAPCARPPKILQQK